MSSSSTKVNVLHIDDEEDILYYSKTLLEEFEPQLNITNVHTPTELSQELDTGKYDLVLSDYRMPEINGIELGEQVKLRYAVPFILYTGQGSEEVAEKAFGVGIDDYLKKEREPAHYQVLARRIMYAVERTRIQAEVKRHEHQLTALHEHSLELNNAQTFNDVSESTIKIMYPNTSFHLIEDDVLVTASVTGQSLRRLRLPLNGKGITVRVVRTGQTVLLGDTRLDSDYVRGPVEALSELAVPAVSQGKVVGVLNTESESLNAFSEGDRKLVELLAGHVASALSRIALRDLEKANKERYENHLIERSSKISSVLNAANKLNEAASLENVIDITLDTVKHDFTLDRAGLGIVENGSIIYKKVNDVELPPDASIPLSRRTVTTRAVNTRKTQRVEDVRLDPDYIVLISDQGYRSELAVPILVDGEVKALINIEDKALGRFTEEDQSLVELLAESVASALKRLEQDNRVEALRQGAHNMSGVNTIEELSRASFQTIHDILGFDSGSLAVIEGENLIHRFSFGWNIPETISMPLNGSGISVRAAVTGEPQLVNDVRLDSSYIYMHQVDDKRVGACGSRHDR